MENNKDNQPQTAQTDNTRFNQQQPVADEKVAQQKKTDNVDDDSEEYTDVLESGLGIDE